VQDAQCYDDVGGRSSFALNSFALNANLTILVLSPEIFLRHRARTIRMTLSHMVIVTESALIIGS